MDARLERLRAIVEQLVSERDQLTEDRDRLIEEIKDATCERDELKQRFATEQIMNSELQHEAELAREERDAAREHADCEKQFADGLKERIAELEMVLDDERAHCEEFKAEADRAQNDVNFFRELFEKAIQQRDHARKCAEEMRDLYAAEIDESIAAFPFSWEVDNGADRDGE